jgi:hypothetical protein
VLKSMSRSTNPTLVFAIALAFVGAAVGPAIANGRHPQVQLGDVPVDLICRALDGQEVFIANARLSGRRQVEPEAGGEVPAKAVREIEVRDGIATLVVPLGNISQLELQPFDSAATFVGASLEYASGESAGVQLRVLMDSGAPLVITGVLPGRASISVELRRCQQITITAAGAGGPPETREPTPAVAE